MSIAEEAEVKRRGEMENVLREDLDHILENTRELWEEVRGTRIFITGGTGFFGAWLLESFAWANARLHLNASAVVLSRNPEAFNRKAPHLFSDPAIHFHAGDVCNFTFPQGSFSHIIHAASSIASPSDLPAPVALFESMVKGARQTCEFARRCSAKKILFTSSGAVYGKQPSELSHVPEEYAGAPEMMNSASAYGEGKRAAEFLTAAYAEQCGFESKIARCFAFAGPHLRLDANFAIGNFMRDALNNEPICIKGDGTPFRSYLYAADLAIWLWTILFKGKSCHPYNVGSDVAVSIAGLAEEVARIAGSSHEVRIEKIALPGKPPERYVPSIKRAQNELGLSVKIPLQESIRRTMMWHKKILAM